jgi:hypothetical protein
MVISQILAVKPSYSGCGTKQVMRRLRSSAKRYPQTLAGTEEQTSGDGDCSEHVSFW